MHQIAILLPEDCFAGGVTGMLDLFELANQQAARAGATPFRCQLLSADGEAVRSSSGLRLYADGDFAAAAEADSVLLPGVAYRDLAAFEARLAREQRLYEWLHRWHAEGKRVAANCTAVPLLAESGLLDGRAATVSWWLLPWFRSRYPRVQVEPYAMLAEAPGLLCGGASTAYLDLALHLVKLHGGGDLALGCARLMLVDTRRSSQAPYASLQDFVAHGDVLVLRCQDWLLDHLAEPYRLATLAEAVGASERTVMRRFRQVLGDTPLHYLQQLRLASARRLLESAAFSLEEIVARVGYSDVGAFRRLFQRELHCTPAEYRRRFAPGASG